MGSEVPRLWRLPLVLSVVFAMGCTTKVINLAVADGGVEKRDVGREDVSADREDASVDREDASVAIEDAGKDREDASVAIEDAGRDRDDADDASSAHLKEAYDAGMVAGPANYAQITCCIIADAEVVAGSCTSVWLGGPDVCYSPAQWKDRAYSHCASVGAPALTDYILFGAC